MAANFNNQILFRSSSAASGNDDYTMLRAGVVYDAFATANDANGGTVTVQNGASAITDAMSINAADETVARAGTINDANNSLAVGDTLRVAKSVAVSSDTAIYIAATGVSQ